MAKNLDPSVWAMESLRFAQNTTYPFVENTNKVDEQYSQLAYETSKKRVVLAGYRIANLVIAIYEKASMKDDTERVEEMRKYENLKVE